MNKRVLIPVLAVAVVACLGAGGFVWWTNSHRQVASTTPTTPDTVQVLVAARDIPAGTPAAQLAAMVTPTKMDRTAAPVNAVTDLARLVGQKSNVAIKAGETLLTSEFTVGAAAGDGDMPRGTVELFMSLSGTSAASGTLKAGQTVSIFVTMPDKKGEQATKQAFSHVPITRIIGGGGAATTSTTTAGSGPSPSPTASDSPSPASQSGTKSGASAASGSLTFGFALTPKDAARLITSFRSGQIWLAVENENSPTGLGPSITPDEVFG